MLFVVAFISVWLLVFKCFCFLGHFVYLVCCAGFPFVGAVLIVFVAIVWFALRGRVDLNMSNFSCLLLLLFSVCGCCSLPYFLLIYFCFCLLFLLFISLFIFILFLLCFCLTAVVLLFGLRIHTWVSEWVSEWVRE